MNFDKKFDLFPVDSFNVNDIISQRPLSNIDWLPKLIPIYVRSRLHVTFIQQPVALPRTIPTLHYEKHIVGRANLVGTGSLTIPFQDIEIRSNVQQIMVYCKRDPEADRLNLIHQMKTASLTKFFIRTDVSNVNLDLQSRYHIEAITTRNYPQYKPPIDMTGNLLALTYNELPRAREVAIEFNHLHGSVTIQQDFASQHECIVYIVVIYKDTFLSIQNDYTFKNRDML